MRPFRSRRSGPRPGLQMPGPGQEEVQHADDSLLNIIGPPVIIFSLLVLGTMLIRRPGHLPEETS